MPLHDVVEILFRFGFWKIADVDIKHTTFGRTRDSVDYRGVFHHAQEIQWLDCFMQPRQYGALVRIVQTGWAERNRVRSDPHTVVIHQGAVGRGATPTRGNKAHRVVHKVLSGHFDDIELCLGLTLALDFSHLPNRARIDNAEFLNARLGVALVHHQMQIEAPVNIPLAHNAIGVPMEVQHLQQINKLRLDAGFEFWGEVGKVEIQRDRKTIRILYDKLIDNLVNRFVDFRDDLHLAITIDELEVIDDAAVEIEVVAKMSTGRTKLYVQRAVLIVRRNETYRIGCWCGVDGNRRR